jgi:hypothetical protein
VSAGFFAWGAEDFARLLGGLGMKSDANASAILWPKPITAVLQSFKQRKSSLS